MADDLGLNNWLKDTFGTTIDNRPLFRIIWSTGLTEKRHGIFQDFYGEVFIREVKEVREVLVYPFAQDRWVLERLIPVEESSRKVVDDAGLVGVKQVYNEIYTFQDKHGNYLPLTRDKLEAAMFLFFEFYLKKTPKERQDFRMSQLAQKNLSTRDRNKDMLGDSLRSPLFIRNDPKGGGRVQ